MDHRNAAENLPMSGLSAGHEGGHTDAPPRVWRFDAFEFDGLRGELRGTDGQVISLRPKAELLLRQFLARPGRLLSRDELMGAVWSAVVVSDDSLVQCVGDLRSALGEAGPRLIRTLPKRGYRFEATVTPVADIQPAPARALPQAAIVSALPAPASGPGGLSILPRKGWLLGLLALVLLAALGGVARWLRGPAPFSIDEALAARSTVAVMPFAIQAGQPQLRDAADALADGVVTQLATRRPSRILGRTATAAFDGESQPLARVAEVLKATHVVTGKVGLAGTSGRLSIDAQITQIEGGGVFWAKHFESAIDARDSIALELGQQVFNAMRNHMVRAEGIRSQRPEHRPDPADLTLLGWDDLDRRQSLADVWRARERFEAALLVDPNSVHALNGLAATYANEREDPANRMTTQQIAEGERVTEAVHKMAPDDATSLMLWGNMQTRRGRPDLALLAFEKAVRVVPSFPNGHVLRARALLQLGRVDEVQAAVDRAVQLGVGDARRTSSAYQLAAVAAVMRGEDERAMDFARRALAEFSSNPRPHATLAAIHALAGRETAAAEEMAVFRKLRPNITLANYDELTPSTQPLYLAKRARYFEGLRKAGLPER